MQKLTCTALLCATTTAWAQTDDWSTNNYIAVQGQYVYMDRNKLGHHELVERVANGKEKDVLSAKELLNDFEFTPGYRVSLGYMPTGKVTCELVYMDLRRWEAHSHVKGSNNLRFPFKSSKFTVDFTDAFEAKGVYKSHYQEAEFNFWNHLTPRHGEYFTGSWLCGFRYMDLKERFGLRFFNDKIPNTSLFDPANARESHYNIETKNRMGVLQLGADLQMNPTKHWHWDVFVKTGPLLNYATVKAFLGDLGDTVTVRDFDKTVCKVGFIIEPSVTLTYQFSAHFNIHAGYQLTYVSGLALAGDQFDKGITPDREFMNLNGDMIIQGGFAGMGIGF